MNLLLRTWNSSDVQSIPNSKQALRYNAGSWIAEIFDNQWTSYDILKTIKVSQTQWQEWLLPHEVPRLPRDSFGVEELQYSQLSPSEIQLAGWTVQMSHLPFEETHPNQAQGLPSLQLPRQTEQRAAPVGLSRPPRKQERGDKRGKPQNRSALPSSNQASRGQPQQQDPGKQAKHSPQQTAVVSISLPIQQWKPLQIQSSQPLQHLTPIVSSGNLKDVQLYSPQRPKNHPGKSSKKRPIVYGKLPPAQSSSVCRIQD